MTDLYILYRLVGDEINLKSISDSVTNPQQQNVQFLKIIGIRCHRITFTIPPHTTTTV